MKRIAIILLLCGSVFGGTGRRFIGDYTRNSIAFYRDDIERAVDEAILPPMAVSGFVTDTSELSNEIAGNALRVQYKATGLATPLLIGHYVDRLYSSTTGNADFIAVSDLLTGKTIINAWAADDLGNCVVSDATNPPEIYFGTMVDGNIEWARAQKDLADFSVTSNSMDKFSFLRTSSGALLLFEYSSGVGGRYIYRSTDKGATWTEVYDAGAGEITHFHGGGQLAATGRIVITAGDAALSRMVYSDDDGENWLVLTADGIDMTQPVAFHDVGHATKLLAGDDTNIGALMLDTVTGAVTRILFDTDHRNKHGFIWNFAENNGVIYASGYETTGNMARHPVIYATTDLENWAVIYRIESNTAFGVKYLEWFNGALHGWLVASGAPTALHMRIVPPVIANKKGILLEGAITNLVDTEAKSSFEDGSYASYFQANGADSAPQVTTATVGVDSIPHGDKAVRVIKTGLSQAIYTIFDGAGHHGVPVVDNGIYVGSVTLGVPTTGVPTEFDVSYNQGSGALSRIAPAGGNATTVDYPLIVMVQPGEWVEVTLPPIVKFAGTAEPPVTKDDDWLGVVAVAKVSVGNIDVLFDKSQITETTVQPSSWQLGGTPRAIAAYDVTWITPVKPSHLFSFAPFAQSIEYDTIGGDFFIRSWNVSPTIHAELYYDSDDQQIKLSVTDGVNTNTLATPATWFKKGQPIIIEVQFGDANDDKVHLSVGTGEEKATVDSTNSFTAFANTEVTISWGDENSANGINGRLYDLEMSKFEWEHRGRYRKPRYRPRYK